MAHTDFAEERPRLLPGWVIEDAGQPNTYRCRDQSGRSVVLRRLDAIIVKSCNGARTLEQLAQVAHQYGSNATLDMVADLVRRLKGLGILEDGAAAQEIALEVGSRPVPVVQAATVPVAPVPRSVSNPAMRATPMLQPAPRTTAPKLAVPAPARVSGSQPAVRPAPAPEEKTTIAAPPSRPPDKPAPEPAPGEDPLSDAFGDETEHTDIMLDPRLDKSKQISPADKVAAQLEALASLALEKNAPAPAAPARGSMLPWVLLVIVVLAGGFLAWRYVPRGPTGGPGPDDSPAAGFRIEPVRAESHTGQVLVAAGFLNSAREPMSVGNTLGGQIKKISVKPNDKVKKNQLLVQFDDGATKAELLLAQAKLGSASRNYKRQQKLLAADATTQTDVDNARGQVEIAAAEVNLIKQKLEQSKVRAPIDATVIEIPVHEGEVIKGDSTAGVLIKLADLTEIVAEVDVNEADVPLVHVAQPADVTSDAAAGKIYAGKVTEVSQQVDRARGTVKVKVRLDEPDDMLRPGMSVKAAFREQADAPPRLLLPRSAVVEGHVWVVDGGKAHQRAVAYQAVGPATVEVSSGLKAGERVVVDGAAKVTEGQRVE